METVESLGVMEDFSLTSRARAWAHQQSPKQPQATGFGTLCLTNWKEEIYDNNENKFYCKFVSRSLRGNGGWQSSHRGETGPPNKVLPSSAQRLFIGPIAEKLGKEWG